MTHVDRNFFITKTYEIISHRNLKTHETPVHIYTDIHTHTLTHKHTDMCLQPCVSVCEI